MIVAAEAFHPSTFISDELEARGWSIGDLAKRMPGEYGINHLAIEMYLSCGPDEPNMMMGDMAPEISKVFGVDPDFFGNLERSWSEHPTTRRLRDEGTLPVTNGDRGSAA